ncbi:hypothetical protein MTR_7g015900 [Medicago truncatula]|uniref:Uncharacterized protein n=1 Tax=Medicago truncatula TaxID=3880 RepID=A0A072U7C3_MEDTR|nr:hypothetical protein MTR_7g015900 [Medicago truncatula]
MRSLERSNLVGCQVVSVDRTVILTCGVLLIQSLSMPLESSFSQGRIIFRDLVLPDLLDFFTNYFKNPLKLLCFGKNRITYSNMKNISNVGKS